jgi:cytochrome c5
MRSRRERVSVLALALAGAVAAGCADDSGGTVPGTEGQGAPFQEGDTLADRECPGGSFLDHGNFGAPFFSEYCTGCHSSQIPATMRQGAPAGVDFETLDGIRARADLIYLRAADGYALMPPVGGPSGETRVLLGEWLACGAP